MQGTHDTGGSVRSVDRAIAILRCFAFDEELRLSQISERVGLPKSTVHRLITSLEQAHFIEQDTETGKYSLGFEIIRLGKQARVNKALCRMIHPELATLAAQTGQTSNLYIIHGYNRLCIDQVEGSEYVRRLFVSLPFLKHKPLRGVCRTGPSSAARHRHTENAKRL